MSSTSDTKEDQPVEYDTATDLDAVRYGLLVQQIPMLYAIMLVASLLVLFVFRNVAPWHLTTIAPAVLLTGTIVRLIFWIKQKNARLTVAQIKRQLKVTSVLGPVMALGFTLWAGLLFDYGDPYQQAFMALMVLICATITAICTAALPLTSSVVIIVACLPFAFKLALNGNEVLTTMVVAFAAIGTALHSVLRKYWLALNDMTNHRSLLAQRNQEITQAKKEITRIAYQDELTDIPNKRRFEMRLSSLIEASRMTEETFYIGVIDLDGFSTINDVFGYEFGDDVLRIAAHRLQNTTGVTDFAARIDGDEFGFVLTGPSDDQDALNLGHDICAALEEHYVIGNNTAILTATCGMAAYPAAGDTPHLLSNRAYYALQQAKNNERTSLELFTPEHEERIQYRSHVEHALRKAIIDRRLNLAYQPIVDLQTKRPIAFEALARWTDEELGVVPPDRFILVAEQTGIINEVTSQLLEKACSDAKMWPEHIKLSFNISAKEIIQNSTGLRTLAILNETQLPGHRLDIEITETAFLEDLDASMQTIENLKLAGVNIALDDFGTGHASLGYVDKISLDKLKIDRSFITNIESNTRSQHIIRAIIEMCDNLEISCIAEGIENEQELDTLKRLGCKFGQGYFFAKPMPQHQVLEFIHSAGMDVETALGKLKSA